MLWYKKYRDLCCDHSTSVVIATSFNHVLILAKLYLSLSIIFAQPSHILQG